MKFQFILLFYEIYGITTYLGINDIITPFIIVFIQDYC